MQQPDANSMELTDLEGPEEENKDDGEFNFIDISSDRMFKESTKKMKKRQGKKANA